MPPKKNPEQGEHLDNLLLISRHFERIADHATTIAEKVICLIEGDIVRHENFYSFILKNTSDPNHRAHIIFLSRRMQSIA
jgi:phosphate transport system protein